MHVSRRMPWPLWAVLVVSLWLALGAAVIWLSWCMGRSIHTCLFKRLTGIPCPTCGFTRGAFCLLHGRVDQAWLYNPLLFSVLGVLLITIVLRLLFAQGVRVCLTRAERAVAWALAIALFCINWAYIVLCVG